MTERKIPRWIIEEKKYEDNGVFCPMLWGGFLVDVDGKVSSCCHQRYVNQMYTSISDYWNSEQLKDMQETMLSGQWPKECHRCHDDEKLIGFSSRMKYLWVNVDSNLGTQHQRALEWRPKVIEPRWSGACNFKCRTCNPARSSAIAAEEYRLSGNNIRLKPNPWHDVNLLTDVIEYAKTADVISLQGGEAMMQPETWELMQALVLAKNTNVILLIISNGSIKQYKNKLLTDYWPHFKRIVFSVSLDAAGEAGEYWRHGLRWDETVQNLKWFKNTFPNVSVRVGITVSWPNAFAVLKLLDELKKLDIDGIRLGLLKYPGHLRISSVPQCKKDEIELAYMSYDMGKLAPITVISTQQIAKGVDGMPYPLEQLQEEFAKMRQIDEFRGEDFFTAFPEHENIRHILMPPQLPKGE